MKLSGIIKFELADAFRLWEQPDGVRVTTMCRYPSGGFVQVIVRGGNDTFFVSDESQGVKEIEASGAEVAKPDRLLRHIVEKTGLKLLDGEVRSATCSRSDLAAVIALVANTSRDITEYLFAHVRMRRFHDFRRELHQLVLSKFEKQLRNDSVVGHSNKPHKFEHLIQLSDGRRIIVDPVMRDPNSINAKIVAHMDVRLAQHADLEQRLVYDEQEQWNAEDLSILQFGSVGVIPFSRAAEVLARLALH